ncbi:MAG: hypothetical protein R3E32_06470 [Chitinophagales bacterium]
MKNIFIFFLFFSSFHVSFIEAQTTQWQHLSGSHRINSLIHDGNIIWFGTEAYGVGQYDRTRNYTTYFNTENSNIPTNNISQIYLTPKGQLWARGENNWFVYDGQNWTVFDETNSPLQSASNSTAYDIAGAKDGTVWLISSNGLLKFNGTSWTTIEVPNQELNNFTSQIAVDADDYLWLNGATHLLQYDGNNWREFVYPEGDILSYSWVSDLKVDSEQNVWMSLSGYYPVDLQTGGLVKFDGEKWTIYSALETGVSLNSYFLAIDQMNKVWVTSNSNTIVSFDGQDFESYSTIVSNASMNPSGIAIDAQNEVWIGTNRGLEKLQDVWFEEVKIAFPEPWLLERLAIKQHLQASNIWFKSLDGFVVFDGTSWTYEPFEGKLEVFKTGFGSVVPTTDGSFWSISQDKIFQCVNSECVEHAPFDIGTQHGRVNDGMEDREGNIWFVVDRRQRLFRYDGAKWTDLTESMKHLNIRNGESIYGITADLNNHIWIGTSKGNLHKWDGERWTSFDLRDPQDFYSQQPIHDLAVNSNNHIWVAHQQFLKLFDGEQVIQTLASEDLGIHETNFWNLNVDVHNNDLWVGTASAGMLHFNGIDWQQYTPENSPLTYNSIDYILIDPKGHKWIVPQYGGYDVFREEGVAQLMMVIEPDEDEESHPDYTVGENIPNPFTDSTRIPIELAEASWVKITLFDNIGQLVAEFNEPQVLAGKHYFELDGTHLKPDIYYYTLETKEGKINGKMLKQ